MWRGLSILFLAGAINNVCAQLPQAVSITERTAPAPSAHASAARNQSSTYLPLDSWVYPAMDRLAAMGYISTSSAAIRPWTRLECARLLAEAHTTAGPLNETVLPLTAALDQEFAFESRVLNGAANQAATMESVYSRLTAISGTPLRDSFHFGQTLIDDFGRPYGKGFNTVDGFSARAQAGAFSLYLRGEAQHAGALPTYNTAAQSAISTFDSLYLDGNLPYNWNLREGETNRLRSMEAYVAFTHADWQFSLGQQSLWWSPDRTTALMLSNNAEAMPMLRVARVTPIRLPQRLSWLGPLHVAAFLAKQGGVHYVALGRDFTLYGNADHALQPAPALWGLHLTAKPSPWLELGFAHTVIFAGYGRAFNLQSFLHTFSLLGNGQEVDPGKRVTELNFTYQMPGLRRAVQLYSEAMAWDNPVEGKFVSRYAFSPGVYLPQLPVAHALDLRMEGYYTDLPGLTTPAYYYSNAHYPQGYTNYGQLLGSWIGRQGRGGQATSTYWFSARNTATLSYRRMTADKAMLEGGSMSDLAGALSFMARKNLQCTFSTQYERWKFPLLYTQPQSNFATTFEIKYFPKANLHLRRATPAAEAVNRTDSPH